MGMLQEFKEFAIKGNMVDMAVGIILGSAFNDVVQTLVSKVILPPLTLLTDGIQFADKKWILREAGTTAAGNEVTEVAIGYGELIENGIDFLVIGFTIFLVIKLMNQLRTKSDDPENPEETTPKNIQLLSDLKNLMKEQNEMIRKSKI